MFFFVFCFFFLCVARHLLCQHLRFPSSKSLEEASVCLYLGWDLGGALGQRAGQYMKATSKSSGCHGTCRPLRVEGSLSGPFEPELKPDYSFFSRGGRMNTEDGEVAPAVSEEEFGCGQVLVWRITRNRVTMSLSFNSEGLE